MDEVWIGRYDKWPSPLSRYSSAKARGSRGGKRHAYDYYTGPSRSLRTEKVKGLAKILPKGPRYRQRRFICPTCGCKSVQLIRKSIKVINCPYCITEVDE